jgi:hypothetical protein
MINAFLRRYRQVATVPAKATFELSEPSGLDQKALAMGIHHANL